MKSYQHDDDRNSPSSTVMDCSEHLSTDGSSNNNNKRRVIRSNLKLGSQRLAILLALAVCLSIACLKTPLYRFISPSYMVPIEMEGMPFRHAEEDATEFMEEGCEATVILMRHCEKGGLKRHCDYIGLERSAYLATLFGNDHHERWPAPSYVFAEGPGGRNSWDKRNYREIETVAPLCQKLGLQADASFTSLDTWELVHHIADLIKRGDVCGKVILVVWKHSQIGHLAHKLGCGPERGCPKDFSGKQFDMIWQLRFIYNFKVSKDPQYRHHMRPGKWQVFGTVRPEDFDPLAFSKQIGDYPVGGRMGRSQWLPDTDVIEGEVVTKRSDNWDEIKPSFVVDQWRHTHSTGRVAQ